MNHSAAHSKIGRRFYYLFSNWLILLCFLSINDTYRAQNHIRTLRTNTNKHKEDHTNKKKWNQYLCVLFIITNVTFFSKILCFLSQFLIVFLFCSLFYCCCGFCLDFYCFTSLTLRIQVWNTWTLTFCVNFTYKFIAVMPSNDRHLKIKDRSVCRKIL